MTNDCINIAYVRFKIPTRYYIVSFLKVSSNIRTHVEDINGRLNKLYYDVIFMLCDVLFYQMHVKLSTFAIAEIKREATRTYFT